MNKRAAKALRKKAGQTVKQKSTNIDLSGDFAATYKDLKKRYKKERGQL